MDYTFHLGVSSQLNENVTMQCMTCNVGGVGSRSCPRLIRDLAVKYRLDVLLLVETRISRTRADKIIRRLGFDKVCKVDVEGF